PRTAKSSSTGWAGVRCARATPAAEPISAMATRASRRRTSALVHRRGQLRQVPMTHGAAADTALARRGIEYIVHPATEGAVVSEHDAGRGAHPSEVVVRRVQLGGERAGVEAS